MATKTFCDRCGAEINPSSRMMCASLQPADYSYSLDYQLCWPCAFELYRWLIGKEIGNDK